MTRCWWLGESIQVLRGQFRSATALILLAVTVLLLTACGGNSSDNDQTRSLTEDPDPVTDTPANPDDTPEPVEPALTSPPVLSGIVTDSGLMTGGRILDDSLSFVGTAPANSVVEVWLNGNLAGSVIADNSGSWSLDYQAIRLDPQAYQIELIARLGDGSSLVSDTEVSFDLDPFPPSAPQIVSFTENTGQSSVDEFTTDTTLEIIGVSEPSVLIRLYLDDQLLTEGMADAQGNWTLSTGADTLVDGRYFFTAEAVEEMVPPSDRSNGVYITVDTQPPAPPQTNSVNGISPSNPSYLSSQQIQLRGSAEPGAQVEVSVGDDFLGTASVAQTGQWGSNINVGVGAINVQLVAIDRAGNRSDLGQLNLIVDPSRPAAPSGLSFTPDTGVQSDNRTNDPSIQISGQGIPGLALELQVNGASVAGATTQVAGDGSWQLGSGLNLLADGDGSYQITALQRSLAGIDSEPSQPLLVILDTVAPSTPQIAEVNGKVPTDEPLYESSQTLVFEGSAEPLSVVTVSTAGDITQTSEVPASGQWSSVVNVPNGDFDFAFVAQDAAGNASVIHNLRIIVDSDQPAAPSILSFAPDTGALGDELTNNPDIQVSGQGLPGLRLRLLVDGVENPAAVTQVGADGNWQLGPGLNLLPEVDGRYEIVAIQTSVTDLESDPSEPLLVEVDTAPPLVDQLVIGDGENPLALTENSISVSFSEAILPGTGALSVFYDDDTLAVQFDAATLDYSERGITANSTTNWVGNSNYYVTLAPGIITDSAGNSFAGELASDRWTFSSEASQIVTTVPSAGAVGVGLATGLSLVFNEDMQLGSGAVELRTVVDNNLVLAWDQTSIQINQNQVELTLSQVLSPNTDYRVLIPAGSFVNARSQPFAGATFDFTTVDLPAPRVINVDSSTPDGEYKAGDLINISLSFSSPVVVSNVQGQPPELALAFDNGIGYATYTGGTATELNFLYLVAEEDETADLGYSTNGALELNGAQIVGENLVPAITQLPEPGALNSLSYNRAISIVKDELDLSDLSPEQGFRVLGPEGLGAARFGAAVAGLGDVNGDGADDFIVGAPGANAEAGQVYVVFGIKNATRTETLSFAIDQLASKGVSLPGANPGDLLGSSVAGAGDVDADGLADILMSAPGATTNGSAGGLGILLYGATGYFGLNAQSLPKQLGYYIATNEGNARLGDSATSGEETGMAIAGGGDFNGDGFADVAVGLPLSDQFANDGGRVQILFGSPDRALANPLLELTSGNWIFPRGKLIYSDSPLQQLGQTVRFIGDYNGDGYDDLLVGGGQAGTELAVVVFGEPGPVHPALNVNAGSAGQMSAFPISGGGLGTTAGSGDINGDGIADLVLSAPLSARAYVSLGETAPGIALDLDYTLSSATAGASFGQGLSGIGDLDADGFDDIVLGDYSADGGVIASGLTWLQLGNGNTTDVEPEPRFPGISEGDRFGQSVSQLDFDGDGFDDVLIGSPGANGGIGHVTLLWGSDLQGKHSSSASGAADVLVGSADDDLMAGSGGPDVVTSGAGDDQIDLDDISFQRIRSGTGTDRLRLSAAVGLFDLTQLRPERLTGIEVLDLGGFGNQLQLNAASVRALLGSPATLTIEGDSSNRIASPTDVWAYLGENSGYRWYAGDGVNLQVNTSINSDELNTFTGRTRLSFDTRSDDTDVSAAVTRFPVFVRLSASDPLQRQMLEGVRMANGVPMDIRFTDPQTQALLPFEVEYWDPNQHAGIWVLVPSIEPNSTSDHILMHWGESIPSTVSDGQNRAELWADYAGVYHFNGSDAGVMQDSTLYDNDGVLSRAGSGSVTINPGLNPDNSSLWRVGPSRDLYAGVTSAVSYRVDDNITLDSNLSDYSVEFWYRTPDNFLFDFSTPILGRGLGSQQRWLASTGNLILLLKTPARLTLEGRRNNGFDTESYRIEDVVGIFPLYERSTWIHYTFTFSGNGPGASSSQYANGIRLDSGVHDLDLEADGNNQPIQVGGQSAQFSIDELRIYRGVLSADRNKLTYANQHPSIEFVRATPEP